MWIILLSFLLTIAFEAEAATLYFKQGATGERSKTSCADTNDTTRCPFSELSTLVAGDTGVIKNGTHNPSSPLILDCNAGANNGTALSPITLRAETERQAHISVSSFNGLTIAHCSWYVVESLYFSGPITSAVDGLLTLNQVADVIVRRNLFYNINKSSGDPQYQNVHGVTVYDSDRVLVEENECYLHYRHCIMLYSNTGHGVQDSTIRRNYSNPRNNDSGRSLIENYGGLNNKFENNIGDNIGIGSPNAWTTLPATGNQFLGNILINGGIDSQCRGGANGEVTGSPGRATNFVYRNNVAINRPFGNLDGGIDFVFSNNSSWNSIYSGVTQIDGGCEGVYGGTTSISGDNNLMMGTTDYGFNIAAGTFSFFKSNADSAAKYNPGTGNAGWNGQAGTTASTSTQNSCPIYIVADSPFKGQGISGADIGANILYRYTNGVLTGTPLWDFTQTGSRRGEPYRSGANQWVGATVAGVNDVAGSSLFDVQTRLGFGNGACPTPNLPTITITSPTSNPTVTVSTSTITLGGTSTP